MGAHPRVAGLGEGARNSRVAPEVVVEQRLSEEGKREISLWEAVVGKARKAPSSHGLGCPQPSICLSIHSLGWVLDRRVGSEG